jgi:2-methylisocitrate lyase-like PEP mutase family enzyme
MSRARLLRERLATGEALLVGGAYNALVARVFERGGFEALYTGGYAAAAANFALPDIGLMTQTEMCAHVERISKAVSLPIISDADTGFGELTNVARTVREYERAGAAAIQIEDQTFPKRCGHMEGKKVISRDEMVRKVRAAFIARTYPDTIVIARTDAIAVNGLDDAIDRLAAYAEAGADVLFPDAPRSVDEMEAISAAVGGRPLIANYSEHGKTPLLTVAETAAAGFQICLYPTTSLFAAAQSAFEIAAALQHDHTSRDVLEKLMVFDDLNELLGLPAWQREEEAAV